MASLLRRAAVMAKSGNGKSTLYWRIQCGTFPRPIKIGVRASAWPESEVDAVNAARIRGATDDEVRALVAELHAQRTAA